MPDHLTYAPLYDNDRVVYGDAMLPNSPAAMLTYTRAIEAKAAWRATQAGKNGNEIWETFLAWRVACIGHNLTVTGRTLATFYHAPPLIRGLPPVRCYDGIVVADGKGGVTLCEPYRYCNCPDLGDMGGNIMSDH